MILENGLSQRGDGARSRPFPRTQGPEQPTEHQDPDGSRCISCRHDNGAWLNAAEDHVLALAMPGPSAGLDGEMTPCMALEDAWS